MPVESPEKTKKLNAVIFTMSEKVEDLKHRLKELEVERDDATEAVRMQEEQIIKLQDRMYNYSSVDDGTSNAATRISELEEQVKDLQHMLAGGKPHAELERLTHSLEVQHKEEIDRIHGQYRSKAIREENRDYIPLGSPTLIRADSRDYIPLSTSVVRRSYSPSQPERQLVSSVGTSVVRRSFSPIERNGAQLLSRQLEPNSSPSRASPTYLSPPHSSTTRLSPAEYRAASPDKSL